MSYENNFDLNSDKQISDYILHDEIGSGGFAKVVQGIHIPTGEKVAVKIMDKIQLFTDPLNLRRVKTEISILKLVRHKNIIKLYEVIETPQKIYLIMEYCEGGELFDYIVQKQNLTEIQACAFFHEIIDALEYLHSINIVHRDIKPENLLLDKINKNISLKLIDFGISNIYDMHNLLITPCGTASYAPPEMHKGEKYYGLLTDIWSAGVVLYAMAFGYLPFCDDDEEINITNIIEGNYEIPNTASPELYNLLLHLLDINPITRYDLDQIKVHPWYNMVSSESNRPGLIVGYHKIPVDERIINICETYGYDTNKVRDSVINNNYDNNSSIYYIILNKMKSMGIDSISDLNSVEYLNYINDPHNIILGKRNIFNNTKFITTDDDPNINYKNNNFLNNNINIQFFSTINPNDNINDNICKKYENIIPKTNIQFAILTHPNKASNKGKKNNTDLINKKQKQEVKYNERKRNISELDNDFDINDKHNKRNNSGDKHNKEDKNNNNKRIVVSTKKAKEKKINIYNIKQILHTPNENIKKKESNKKPKIDNNTLVFQTNKTFFINSKYKMNNDEGQNQNQTIKRQESFDKKLTDDIKEKILKLRNPKKNDKKQKINEAKLKMQLKMRKIKKYKNNLNNEKIVQKIPIFNKDRKKHTIIHNRNASATPHRYMKNKNNNNININYINNNISINNIYIKKIREHSSSPSNRHKKNNSSFIKYQKINKNNHILNYPKYSNKNNISLITKKCSIDDYDKSIHDNSIMNISVKHMHSKPKNRSINTRLSGPKIDFKKILNNINKEIIYKNDRNRNISLTNRRKAKETPKSIHFLSFLKNYNKLSESKKSNNQSNIVIKNSYLNESNSTKKNNLFHNSFNTKNYNTINVEYKKKNSKIYPKKENKSIINNIKINLIKKNIYRKEINDNNISFISRTNRLGNCISPTQKGSKGNHNISNYKRKNKNMSLILNINTNRKINHNKCNSMKYIENNSSSFNYDSNYNQKFHINHLNNSYRERDKKFEKEKSNEKRDSLKSNKKGVIKKGKIMNLLSFKVQNNNKNNSNYKSNYLLKNNIIIPKKYKGPIEFRNIVIGGSAMDICDELESILKKNNINLHRINPFKIVCWKNSEMIEINIYSISGDLTNKNKHYGEDIDNSINILDTDSNDFGVKFSNTYTGFYKTEKNNKKNNINVKNNIFYINIFSQKDKKIKTCFELINKIIYNKYSLVKNCKK